MLKPEIVSIIPVGFQYVVSSTNLTLYVGHAISLIMSTPSILQLLHRSAISSSVVFSIYLTMDTLFRFTQYTLSPFHSPHTFRSPSPPFLDFNIHPISYSNRWYPT